MTTKQPKHNAYDLKQMQSLPLEQKIIMSKRRIEEWHDYWNENGGALMSRLVGARIPQC